jgi:hypothetical protein
VHTAAWIVKKCLRGDLLKGRTVLLVVSSGQLGASSCLTCSRVQTHNVALTTPVASFVVAMGSDGRIISQGSPSETLLQNKALAKEVKHEQEAIELEDGLEDDEEDEDKKATAKGAKVLSALSLSTVVAQLFAACSRGGDRARPRLVEGGEPAHWVIQRVAYCLLVRLLDRSLVRLACR